MNCTFVRSIGTTPYEIVYNRKPHYRRIPLLSRPGYEIEDEVFDDGGQDDSLREFTETHDTEVTDADMAEAEREARARMAERRDRAQKELEQSHNDGEYQRQIGPEDYDDFAGHHFPDSEAGAGPAPRDEEIPDNDCVYPDERSTAAQKIAKEAFAKMSGGLNSGAPAEGADAPEEQLGEVQKSTTGAAKKQSTSRKIVPDSQADDPIEISSRVSSTSSSSDEAEAVGDGKGKGQELPHTPPKSTRNEGTGGPGNLLSPKLDRLQLGDQNGRAGIAELDGTPTTKVRQDVFLYQKKAQERSIKAYGKQRRVEVYAIGQKVSVAIPKEDRSSTDDRRVLGKVIQAFEEMNQYEIVTQWGVLDRYCPINIVNPVESGVDVAVPDPPPTQKVTLSFCAGQQSTSQKVGIRCDCKDRKTWCSKRTCKCIKAGVKCSIHCHSSQGHPDTRIECPNVSPIQERTRMGLGTREQQQERAQIEKRQRRDTAGNWVRSKGIGFGPVDGAGNVDEGVRREHEKRKQRRR